MENQLYAVIQAKPEAKDIFRYKMYHSFSSFAGVVRILISFAFILTAFATRKKTETVLFITLLSFGLLNPVITPLWFLFQSASAAKKCIQTTYTFTKDSIDAFDGKKRVKLSWNNLSLVVWLKNYLLLYTTPAQAFVIPTRQMGSDRDVLYEISSHAVKENRLVIKH